MERQQISDIRSLENLQILNKTNKKYYKHNQKLTISDSGTILQDRQIRMNKPDKVMKIKRAKNTLRKILQFHQSEKFPSRHHDKNNYKI